MNRAFESLEWRRQHVAVSIIDADGRAFALHVMRMFVWPVGDTIASRMRNMAKLRQSFDLYRKLSFV
ncbi:MAG: hypothetical protein ABF608_04960 [Sporolactobacillus sp.]